MFKPASITGDLILQFGRSQPDSGNWNRMRRRWPCRQRIIESARGSLLAAATRFGHLHLSALVIHHAAAGALFGGHPRGGDHTGHRRRQRGRQQQDQYSEFAQRSHSSIQHTLILMFNCNPPCEISPYSDLATGWADTLRNRTNRRHSNRRSLVESELCTSHIHKRRDMSQSASAPSIRGRNADKSARIGERLQKTSLLRPIV